MPHDTHVRVIGSRPSSACPIHFRRDVRPRRAADGGSGIVSRRDPSASWRHVPAPRSATKPRLVLRLPDPGPHGLAVDGLAHHDGVVLGAVDEVLRAVDGVDGERVVGDGIPLHERRVARKGLLAEHDGVGVGGA